MMERPADDAFAHRAPDDLSLLQHVEFVPPERFRFHMPVHVLVSFAEDLPNRIKTVIIEKALARAEKAALFVFPEEHAM